MKNGSRPEEIQQAQHNLDEARATPADDKITLGPDQEFTARAWSRTVSDDATAKSQADQQRVNSLNRHPHDEAGAARRGIARAKGAMTQARARRRTRSRSWMPPDSCPD